MLCIVVDLSDNGSCIGEIQDAYQKVKSILQDTNDATRQKGVSMAKSDEVTGQVSA